MDINPNARIQQQQQAKKAKKKKNVGRSLFIEADSDLEVLSSALNELEQELKDAFGTKRIPLELLFFSLSLSIDVMSSSISVLYCSSSLVSPML